MSIREQLRQTPLFSSLPPVEIDVLAATLAPIDYPADGLIFYEGDPGDRMYIVLSGEVEVIKALGTDEERLLGSFAEGEILGEMSLLEPDANRSASARAKIPTQVLEMTRADFEKLVRRYPPLMFEILHVLSARLRASDDARIRDLEKKNMELAIANAELKAAQERAGE